MLPRPQTARVLPRISPPPNFDLSFSTRLLIAAASASSFTIVLFTWLIPPTMSRDASRRPASTSSFTELAFAPGVLKTGMPRCVIASIGMLFVPAPHRAIARVDAATSSGCSLCERSRIACGSSATPAGTSPLEPVSANCPVGKRCSPTGEIALNVWIWNFGPPPAASPPAAAAASAFAASASRFCASESSCFNRSISLDVAIARANCAVPVAPVGTRARSGASLRSERWTSIASEPRV